MRIESTTGNLSVGTGSVIQITAVTLIGPVLNELVATIPRVRFEIIEQAVITQSPVSELVSILDRQNKCIAPPGIVVTAPIGCIDESGIELLAGFQNFLAVSLFCFEQIVKTCLLYT